jgi:serine/threonine protein kinase
LAKNKCPNFPLVYDSQTCSDCEGYARRSGPNCFVLLYEYANGGNLEHFLSRNDISDIEFLSIYFQAFYAYHILEKYTNGIHGDFLPRNILLSNTTPGGFWVYILDGTRYYIPNIGYIVKIWDYSIIDSEWMENEGESTYSSSTHKLKNSPILEIFRKNIDKMAREFTPISTVIHKLFNMFTTSQTNIIDIYTD